MRITQTTCMLTAVAGLLCAPERALAQTATPAPTYVPLRKTIG